MRYIITVLLLIMNGFALEVHEWGTFTTDVLPDGRQLFGLEKGKVVWNFSKETFDEISWRGTILGPESEASYTSPQEQETVTWVNPHTDSKFLKILGQVEKFIFYRGVATFEEGLSYNLEEKNKLKISNKYTDTVPYVLVYEYKEGKRIVHADDNHAEAREA